MFLLMGEKSPAVGTFIEDRLSLIRRAQLHRVKFETSVATLCAHLINLHRATCLTINAEQTLKCHSTGSLYPAAGTMQDTNDQLTNRIQQSLTIGPNAYSLGGNISGMQGPIPIPHGNEWIPGQTGH